MPVAYPPLPALTCPGSQILAHGR